MGRSNASHLDLRELLAAAGRESSDPAGAREVYRRARNANLRFRPAILVLAVVSVTLASLLASRADGWPAVLTLLTAVGVAPPLLLRLHLDGLLSRVRPGLVLLALLELVAELFSSQAQLGWRIARRVMLMVAPVVFFSLAIILWLGDARLEELESAWPLGSRVLGVAVLLPFGVAAVLDLAQVWWRDLLPPRLGWRVLAAGLWVNRLDALASMALLVAILVLATETGESLFGGFFGGAFLGLGLARRVPHREVAEAVALGLLRCDLRQGRWGFAGCRLREIWRAEQSAAHAEMLEGQRSGWTLMEGDTRRPRLHLMRVLAVTAERLRHRTAGPASELGRELYEAARIALVPEESRARSEAAEAAAIDRHLARARRTARARPVAMARLWLAATEATRELADEAGEFEGPVTRRASWLDWRTVARVGRVAYAGLTSTGAGAVLGAWVGSRLGGGFAALAALTLGMLLGLGLAPVALRIVQEHGELMGMRGD